MFPLLIPTASTPLSFPPSHNPVNTCFDYPVPDQNDRPERDAKPRQKKGSKNRAKATTKKSKQRSGPGTRGSNEADDGINAGNDGDIEDDEDNAGHDEANVDHDRVNADHDKVNKGRRPKAASKRDADATSKHCVLKSVKTKPSATAMSKSSKQGQGKKARSNQVAVDEAPAASGTAPGVKLTAKAKGQSRLAKRKAEVLFYFILLIDYSFFLLAAPSRRG